MLGRFRRQLVRGVVILAQTIGLDPVQSNSVNIIYLHSGLYFLGLFVLITTYCWVRPHIKLADVVSLRSSIIIYYNYIYYNHHSVCSIQKCHSHLISHLIYSTSFP